jgi:hypothetical protein
VKLSAKVPFPLTWHICHIIDHSLGLVEFTYILNQSRGHWLLSDALNSAISMSLKSRGEIDYITFENLIKEDGNVVYELSCLVFNIKKLIVKVLDYFLSF